MIRESAFKESLTFSVQLVSNASTRLHLADMPDVRRHGERGDGAFSRTDAEENLRHADTDTDTDTAQEKEDRYGCEKEIANPNPDSENDAITDRRCQKENKPVADSVAAPEEKIFAISKSDRNAIAIANSDSGVEWFAASEKKGFAVSGSI
jgi:hypothetical protein